MPIQNPGYVTPSSVQTSAGVLLLLASPIHTTQPATPTSVYTITQQPIHNPQLITQTSGTTVTSSSSGTQSILSGTQFTLAGAQSSLSGTEPTFSLPPISSLIEFDTQPVGQPTVAQRLKSASVFQTPVKSGLVTPGKDECSMDIEQATALLFAGMSPVAKPRRKSHGRYYTPQLSAITSSNQRSDKFIIQLYKC